MALNLENEKEIWLTTRYQSLDIMGFQAFHCGFSLVGLRNSMLLAFHMPSGLEETDTERDEEILLSKIFQSTASYWAHTVCQEFCMHFTHDSFI